MTAQFIPESTHDWTSTAGAPTNLSEAWADTKTPGKGFTYSVGTIEVEQTTTNPTFSTYLSTGLPASVSNPTTLSVPFSTIRKQVAILQCVDAVGEIQWQRYLFGVTNTPGARRATNARAISVWEAESAADARIAICGETYDDVLPLSQDPTGFVQNPALLPDPTGFIAVYNGDGVLLWSHHFFGVPLATPLISDNQPDCAITDLSIRVEGEGANQRDVVTYCGISSYGNPTTGNAWLDPILPFASVTTATSAGNTDFGPYQWDGIVGRLSRDHATPYGNLAREFHASVGGPEQDGLFGIAEIADNRFVVVGSSQQATAPTVGFPFVTISSIVTVPTPAYPYRVAVVLGFDATPTRLSTPAALEIENGLPLGSFGGVASHACDVVVQPRNYTGPLQNTVFVVGTTADANFLTSVGAPTTSGHDVLQGSSDGFLLAMNDVPVLDALQVGLFGGVFVGGSGDDGLTGVNSWNEHTDHAQVCGYSVEGGSVQVQVASFFSAAPIAPLRRNVIGGAGTDRPTVMGTTHAGDGASGVAFGTGLPFPDPAGGGISADERARITVVGASDSATGYPVVGGRGPLGAQDAVRTEFDMLPTGVGRTDGTGSVASGAAAPPPPTGFSGGTTPACLLTPSPYGWRVGETAPLLQRMLIEFEGANAPGAFPVIWTTRPPDFGDVVIGALQFGLPATTPFLLNLAELWTLNNPVLVTELWVGNSYRPWAIPFTVALPAAPAQFSVQVACLVLTPFTATPCGSQQLDTFASPALFFEY